MKKGRERWISQRSRLMRNKDLDRKIASTEAGASLQGGEPQAVHWVASAV